MTILNNILLSLQTELADTVAAKATEQPEKSFFADLEKLSLDDAIAKIANSLVDFAFKLAIAVLIFYLGKFIITRLYKMTHSVMLRKNIDRSLTTFVLSFIKITLYFILIVTIIGILGVETSSFLALFASAGVAIGMALSGTLQNFAGGVLILFLKPYKVGDYIEAQGYSGTVKEIQIFHTVINTPDNKAIIIPNGGLSTSSINNYSLEDYRRVDWTVCLAYGTDFTAAKAKILEMLAADDRVVKEYIEDDIQYRTALTAPQTSEEQPTEKSGILNKMRRKRKEHIEERKEAVAKVIEAAKVSRKPAVEIDALADSSINIVVRVWTHSSNYWGLYYTMNERFYTELPQSGFEFPFPQMDIHLHQQS